MVESFIEVVFVISDEDIEVDSFSLLIDSVLFSFKIQANVE